MARKRLSNDKDLEVRGQCLATAVNLVEALKPDQVIASQVVSIAQTFYGFAMHDPTVEVEGADDPASEA